MLPHTKDLASNSLPASRVGSSARLSSLAVPNLPKALSRPGTPGTPSTYVASSLNPSRNVPITVESQSPIVPGQETAKHESLVLLEKVQKFESVLGDLSQSLSSFERDNLVDTVQNLIDINDDIDTGLQQLEKHRKLGEQAEALSATNKDLDSQSKHILRELISCRAQLKKLSSLPASKDHTLQTLRSVDVKTLIEYSMKLAKFSKTPATVQSPFIHPNNFVWPAEDALRRGMLAMASLKPDELIKAELGSSDPAKSGSPDGDVVMEDVQMEDVQMEEAAQEPVKAEKLTETSKPESQAAVRSEPKAPAKSKPAASLDLDLFDSGDDDSD